MPDLSLISFDLVVNALAIAVIVLVQGVWVSEAAPNADGRPSNMNRDFLAQGVGNLAAGLFRGQPVGGSVGQTALNSAAGARTRWAAIWSGIWMVVILIAFAGVVGKVAMPTLAAVLIFAAIGSLRPGEMATIWRTGRTSQIALAATFVATLFLPVAAAVGVGVVLSLLLQLNQEAMDLTVVELVPSDGDQFREQPAPRTLTSHQATVLDVYGSLLYAGARTLQARLPDVADTEAPAVVLRLRGRTSLGATFFRILAAYAEQLAAAGGRSTCPDSTQTWPRAWPEPAGSPLPPPCECSTPHQSSASPPGRRCTTPKHGSSNTTRGEPASNDELTQTG